MRMAGWKSHLVWNVPRPFCTPGRLEGPLAGPISLPLICCSAVVCTTWIFEIERSGEGSWVVLVGGARAAKQGSEVQSWAARALGGQGTQVKGHFLQSRDASKGLAYAGVAFAVCSVSH